MSLHVDWTKANSNIELYPAGTYKVCITRWEYVTAKTGSKQIRWVAEIEEPTEFATKPILDHCVLSENTTWKLANFVSSCGINTNKLPITEVGSPSFERILDACVGRSMYWNLNVETYQGINRNKVQEYLRDEKQPPLEIEIGEGELPDFLEDAGTPA
jgi:hypothetical protein